MPQERDFIWTSGSRLRGEAAAETSHSGAKISLRQGSTNYSTQVKFQALFLYYLQAKNKFYTCTFTTDLMIGNTKLVYTPIG